jgi:hypothetical protein
MENLRTSKRTVISRDGDKYYLSTYNPYTNSTKTYFLDWNSDGECRIEGEGFYRKATLDVSFETSKIFEIK